MVLLSVSDDALIFCASLQCCVVWCSSTTGTVGLCIAVLGSLIGKATFTMTFDHYEPVPFSLAEEIVASRAKILAGRRF